MAGPCLRLRAPLAAAMSATRSPSAINKGCTCLITKSRMRTNMLKKSLLCVTAALAFPIAASATQYQVVERPRQECWNEQVPAQTGTQDFGGAILGGLAGGILGNQVGHGNGRTAATAVGAVTGAMVGDRMANSRPGYQTVQRCRTVVDHVRVAVPDPAPVYVEPRPVYVEPEPVYVQPAPVVVEPRYYVMPGGQPYYREYEYREHERRHEHERHHRHDDDD